MLAADRVALGERAHFAHGNTHDVRLRLIEIAARIIETASTVRVAFAAAHPEAALFARLARCIQPAGP